MIKAYKYKLRPTPTQERIFNQWLGTTRLIYNLAKEVNESTYKATGKGLGKYDLQAQVIDLKKDYDWMRELPKDTLIEPAFRFYKSMQAFFKKNAKYPRWAKKKTWNSLVFVQQGKGLRIEGKKIKLHKGILLRYFNSRSLPEGAKIKQIILSKELDGWYASIQFEDIIHLIKPPHDSQVVGIDMGVKHLATLSNGKVISNINVYKVWQSRLTKAQQNLSRKKKGSANWIRQARQVASIHRKMARIRNDHQHKVTTALVDKYSGFVVEDLRIRNMVRSTKGTIDNPGKNVEAKSGLNRSILDAGFGGFLAKLEYKSNWHGRFFQKVDPRHTSQICNACGYQDSASRKDQQTFVCASCGHTDNADVNAAKNILGRAVPVPYHAKRVA
jgi:putative transposase